MRINLEYIDRREESGLPAFQHVSDGCENMTKNKWVVGDAVRPREHGQITATDGPEWMEEMG